MKIAIIGDRGIPARYSGLSTLVEELAVRLVQDHAMDVTVYCRKHYYNQCLPTYNGVRCVYLPAPGGKNFESIIHSNLAILHAAFRYFDLAFIGDPGIAPFSLPLVLRRLPIVFHTDGLGWKRQKWNRLQQRYYKWSESVCARLCSWLVTDSRAMQEYYLSEYQAPSSFIPYAGVVGAPPNDACLEKYGLEKQGYYLVVARVEPENNIDLIIREYRAANATKPLVVVGGVPYESSYARNIFVEADKQLRCLGAIYDSDILNGLYKNCYVYLHGHEVGGTNPSLLRAMNAGAACVPIDVVFHREVLSDAAIFFEKTPGNLAKIINRLEVDHQHVQSLGHLARKRSDMLYRWDAVAAAYSELFQKVAKAKQERRRCQELLNEDVYRPLEFCPSE